MPAKKLLASCCNDGKDGHIKTGPVDSNVRHSDDADAQDHKRNGQEYTVAELTTVGPVLHNTDEGNYTELSDLVEANLQHKHRFCFTKDFCGYRLRAVCHIAGVIAF